MWYVYIIRSTKFKYNYTGSTNNLNRRLREHNDGMCKASSHYRPFKLFTYFAVKNKDKAVKLERYLKTGSGKAFLAKRVL